MRIYVAGPMRHRAQFNFPAFERATAKLRAQGHEVFSPAERDLEEGFDPSGMKGTDEELAAAGFDLRNALAHDLDWIARTADGIYLLEGWERSSGARAEKAVADALGLRVFYEVDPGPSQDKGLTVLEEAAQLTSRDRHDVYGHPRDNFAQIAELWAAYLAAPVTAEQVAVCNILQKVARLASSPGHRDSLVDIAGYARTAEMLGEEGTS